MRRARCVASSRDTPGRIQIAVESARGGAPAGAPAGAIAGASAARASRAKGDMPEPTAAAPAPARTARLLPVWPAGGCISNRRRLPMASKRELIEPHKGDKRYARRDEQGRFT